MSVRRDIPVNIRKWAVSGLDKDRAARIAEQYGLPFFLAMLLDIRGFLSEAQIRSLLEGDGSLSDPFLMKDMDRAVERIRRAVDAFEKIAIYGDYDADGVTATAMLYTYLEALGADVMYYIPQREGEGYGMNLHAVETLCQAGVKLIITVDNGISSVEEIRRARELGMDVVVTDHHRPQEVLPEAAAVVNAYQQGDGAPFRDFSGAGVVFKLLIALEDGNEETVMEEYADLAALGTIGDVVPMLGENRAIVKAGLRSIARGGRVGLDALMELCSAAGRSATAGSLAFTAIPRINATGRMGSPERAVRLLTCESEEEAQGLAEEICADNDERRKVEAEITAQAVGLIEQNPLLRFARVIVVCGRDWHHGVIGIVASRITERYGKPCFVVSEDGENAKGSGRSVGEFSLFDAVSACAPVLERFGGHPMAAGVTLKANQVEAFRLKINEFAAQVCEIMPAAELRLDCKLNPASLSVQMPQDIQSLEPFGAGNQAPLFGLFDMTLSQVIPVGNGNHLRLICEKKGACVTCMRFGVKEEEFPFVPGDRIDLAVSLEAREYRGAPQLTVQVKDIRLSGLDMEECLRSFRYYEKFRREEALTRQESQVLTPTRDELAALYRRLVSESGKSCSAQTLLAVLATAGFSMGKLLLCLDILEERGLILRQETGESFTIEAVKTAGKVDIFASPVFLALRRLGGEG